MTYPYLLLDADNTLFNFDRANREAFHAVCTSFAIPESDETFALYERCNNEMWAAFDRGECTKEFLVVQRFRNFLAAMGLDRSPEGCNALHLQTLSRCAFMLPYAEEVCRTLSRDHKLYLVTNAVASVQRGRLAKSPIVPYITAAFISEEAGAAKPDPAYFDYVFAHIDGITRENCLVIGDSISSDIRGANNYGLPCGWYNPGHTPRPDGLRIDYEITNLRQLYDIV